MSIEHKPKLGNDENLITTESLMELLGKMTMSGYFHPGGGANKQATCDDHNYGKKHRVEATMQSIHSSSPKNDGMNFSITDSLVVLPTLSSVRQGGGGGGGEDCLFVMTKERLAIEIQKCVNDMGRISYTELTKKFNFSKEDIEMATRIVVEMKNKYPIEIVGNDVLNEKYLDDFFRKQVNNIRDKKLVQDIALECNLPLQFIMSAITKRIQEGFLEGIQCMTLWDGTKQIVTQKYEKHLLHFLEDTLQSAKEPISMANIVSKVPLDPNVILNHIRNQCRKNSLEGYLQEDSSSCAITNPLSVVYVPRSYKHRQEEEVLSFFNATGYITFEKGEQIGLSKKRLMQVISMNNPQAVILNKCIVFRNKIEPPIRSALEECMILNTFLDLSQYFPEKMSVSDSVTFLKDYVFCDMDDSVLLGCLIFLVDKEPFYFSHGMIKNISTKLLQSLMVDFAKQRAKEVVDGSESGSLDANHEITQKSNNKRIGKGASWKKRMKRDSLSLDKSVSYGIVPLVTIANAVSHEYPDLAEIQRGYEINFEANHIPQWNDEKDGSDGPLYSFCRHVFGMSQKFHEDCTKAVEVEIAKLRTMKIGASIQSCSTMNVAYNEESFESAFKSACYFLQLLAKYPKSLMNSSKEQNGKAQDIIDMFLTTCAADFTRRLTEYVLFKYGVQHTLFSFYHEQETPLESDHFCSEIDTSTKRNFPHVFLSCSANKDSAKCDPLQMLQDVLPANKGANLAQMWILCGGQTYHGGEIDSKEGSKLFCPGNLDKFMNHIQDTCLNTCGIPFKVLDEKIEKHILTARRKELTSQLDRATNPNDILELSFILLFQKLKGLAICNMTQFTIDDLCHDKKIPTVVKEVLQKLAQSLEQGIQIDATTLKAFKGFGLCKDLSRYCAHPTV